jgi:hypothetical protein
MIPLPHTVTILRATRTTVSGEIVPGTPAEVATGVRCRIEESHGKSVVTPAGLSVAYHAEAIFQRGIDVRPGATAIEPDELLVTAPTTGPRYRVLAVADEAGTGHHLVAKLQRVGV